MIGSHVTPRFNLEQFAIKKRPKAKTGQLWVYEKGKPPRPSTAKNEGRENGYFGILREGVLDESLENRLAELEQQAQELLLMLPNPCFVWSPSYQKQLAFCIALMHSRSTVRRDFISGTTRM